MTAIIVALIDKTYPAIGLSMVAQVLIYAAVIITIISGLDYFVKNKTVISETK